MPDRSGAAHPRCEEWARQSCASPWRSTPCALRGQHHRIDDMLVARAAAEVARQRFSHLRFGRLRALVEEDLHGHQDAGRTIAALQSMAVTHGLLQRMQMV